MKFRLSSFVILVAAIGAGTLLFWTSQRVQNAEYRLQQISSAVSSEENTIRVLKAEWAYLTRPDRLEALARTYLGMKPSEAQQVAGSAGAIPTIPQPSVPERKPTLNAQPAIARKNEPAMIPQALEPVAPQRSFRSLLDDIGRNEGGEE